MPDQAYKSEELTSGDVKPHSVSKRQGDLQSLGHVRGESVEANNPADEVSGATGTRCGGPIEETPSGDPVAHSPRASSIGNSGIPMGYKCWPV